MTIRTLVTLFGWLGVVLLTGCSDKYPDLYPVTGRVTFKGQPVPSGTITFYPQDGSRPANCTLSGDGSYRLMTYEDGPGAVSGPHKVTIEAVKQVTEQPEGDGEDRGQNTVEPDLFSKAQRTHTEWIVPIEYSHRDTSPLRAKVEHDENKINFDLPVK